MKKLTKTTALILSALMLFGCTSNSATGGVGDTTPPSESSVTDSKNESKVESPVTENSSTPDNSNDKSDENLVENIDGYQTFSYDKNKYVKTTFRRIYNLKRDGLGAFTGETVTLPLARYAVQDEVLVIKCKVAGDSYIFNNGKSGSKTVPESASINSSDTNDLTGIFTPIVIEEVIDKTADAVSDLKTGDIIYIQESFYLCEHMDEQGDVVPTVIDEFLDEKNAEIAEYENEIKAEKAKENPDQDKIDDFQNKIYEIEDIVGINSKMNDYIKKYNGKVILTDNGSPMEKEVSYLAFVAVTPVPGTNDGNSYHKAYPMKYDLACDDVPSLFGDDDIYFQGLYGYEKSWKAMKEKYGDHFKK